MDEPIKLHFSDKILAKVVLPFVPRSITPNQVTILRFFLTPIVLLLLWLGYILPGVILFLFAAFTDALDGTMARVRNQITDWGKFYDPLADKILIGTTLYVLILKYVDIYAAGIIILLELIIILGALYKKYRRHEEIQANVWGKIKMVLQVLGVVLLLVAMAFDVQALLPFSNGVFYVAIAFAVMSLFTQGI